jgi:triosephosphate isomerase (TIM)
MKYIFANWKMYLDFAESMILANQLAGETFNAEKLQIGLFPSSLAFTEVEKLFRESSIVVGAQDVSWSPKGAYTGAVSAELFSQAGAQYALVGHSERRHVFGESDSDIKKKFEACLNAGIIPILCIGETKDDLDNNKREYRLKKQLMALEGVSSDSHFFVAYEPVWAIGTGEACDYIMAAQMHDMVKTEVAKYTSKEIPVLYGGSVNAENVISYLPHGSIDGFLVGGASSKFESFSSLLSTVEKA